MVRSGSGSGSGAGSSWPVTKTRFAKLTKTTQSIYSQARGATSHVVVPTGSANLTPAPVIEWWRAGNEYYCISFVRENGGGGSGGGEIELSAHFAISPEYPFRSPHFKLSFVNGKAPKHHTTPLSEQLKKTADPDVRI